MSNKISRKQFLELAGLVTGGSFAAACGPILPKSDSSMNSAGTLKATEATPTSSSTPIPPTETATVPPAKTPEPTRTPAPTRLPTAAERAAKMGLPLNLDGSFRFERYEDLPRFDGQHILREIQRLRPQVLEWVRAKRKENPIKRGKTEFVVQGNMTGKGKNIEHPSAYIYTKIDTGSGAPNQARFEALFYAPNSVDVAISQDDREHDLELSFFTIDISDPLLAANSPDDFILLAMVNGKKDIVFPAAPKGWSINLSYEKKRPSFTILPKIEPNWLTIQSLTVNLLVNLGDQDGSGVLYQKEAIDAMGMKMLEGWKNADVQRQFLIDCQTVPVWPFYSTPSG